MGPGSLPIEPLCLSSGTTTNDAAHSSGRRRPGVELGQGAAAPGGGRGGAYVGRRAVKSDGREGRSKSPPSSPSKSDMLASRDCWPRTRPAPLRRKLDRAAVEKLAVEPRASEETRGGCTFWPAHLPSPAHRAQHTCWAGGCRASGLDGIGGDEGGGVEAGCAGRGPARQRTRTVCAGDGGLAAGPRPTRGRPEDPDGGLGTGQGAGIRSGSSAKP